MELTYKNTEIDQINLPTTITLADNADKIFELLKSSDVKTVTEKKQASLLTLLILKSSAKSYSL